MKLLLASSEVHPYSKTGGLADAVGALGKALARAGHQVGIVTPLYRGIRALDLEFLDWSRGGPYVVGALLAIAGVYELTPLKSICLRHCRSPLHFLLGGWRDGVLGAIRMGAEHGAYCVGCCWGLMVVLFALGVMSILWMAVVAALIFAQKLLPRGEMLARIFAVAFVSAGIWIAAAPGTVPGLTQPGTIQNQMQMNR